MILDHLYSFENVLDSHFHYTPLQLHCRHHQIIVQSLYHKAEFRVESAASRIFTDEEYSSKGIQLTNDVADCDVLIGINPIAPSDLIPGKEYVFVADLIKIGKKIDESKVEYAGAMNKLVEGKGNLISSVERLKKMGAKAKKALPDTILNRADKDENQLES